MGCQSSKATASKAAAKSGTAKVPDQAVAATLLENGTDSQKTAAAVTPSEIAAAGTPGAVSREKAAEQPVPEDLGETLDERAPSPAATSREEQATAVNEPELTTLTDADEAKKEQTELQQAGDDSAMVEVQMAGEETPKAPGNGFFCC